MEIKAVQAEKKIKLLRGVVSFACVIIILFNWLWGFNYARVSFEDHINLPTEELDSMTLRGELEAVTQQLVRDKKAVMEQMEAPEADNEALIRENLSRTLTGLGYQPHGRPRVQIIKPAGLLMRWGVSGVYWPFIGQGNMDDALHPILKPFVMAHEMAHAYGITDEGSCNFLAYISCATSDSPDLQYSASMSYFRTVAVNYKVLDSMAYLKHRSTIPGEILSDLDSINIALMRFKPWVSTTAIYDYYLQLEGIEEGIDNYDKIIGMVYAWRKLEDGSMKLEDRRRETEDRRRKTGD